VGSVKIISFAYTTPALLAGRKTCTRRNWAPRYAALFNGGELVQAWDKSPRIGGKRIGTIRLLQEPRLEPLNEMPDSDYEAEGFAYLHQYELNIGQTIWGSWSKADFDRWRQSGEKAYVIRFESVLYEPRKEAVL
jgi:hypothetical protein